MLRRLTSRASLSDSDESESPCGVVTDGESSYAHVTRTAVVELPAAGDSAELPSHMKLAEERKRLQASEPHQLSGFPAPVSSATGEACCLSQLPRPELMRRQRTSTYLPPCTHLCSVREGSMASSGRRLPRPGEVAATSW
ncbi:hypothetical protein NDU88_007225 [Pleurodeles waltl]|uniref:Uncharacterized protein n=1 Tax=Pleurodeles waltl TaxID=8319 RepID=A0AAV7NU83_PLEWA|nr:hypothetical protein NDU88_007225 [Pleurodeles waltl]